VVDRNLLEPVVIDTKGQPVNLGWGSLVHGSQSGPETGELNIGAAVTGCTAARNRSVENPHCSPWPRTVMSIFGRARSS